MVVTCFMEIMSVVMPRPSTLATAVLKISISVVLRTLGRQARVSRPTKTRVHVPEVGYHHWHSAY